MEDEFRGHSHPRGTGFDESVGRARPDRPCRLRLPSSHLYRRRCRVHTREWGDWGVRDRRRPIRHRRMDHRPDGSTNLRHMARGLGHLDSEHAFFIRPSRRPRGDDADRGPIWDSSPDTFERFERGLGVGRGRENRAGRPASGIGERESARARPPSQPVERCERPRLEADFDSQQPDPRRGRHIRLIPRRGHRHRDESRTGGR